VWVARAHRRKRGLGTSFLLAGLAAALPSFAAGATLAAMAKTPPPIAPLQGPALRVMSFNIRVDTPSDGPHVWANRRDLVAATMRFHQADLIGVQESYRHMTDDLQHRLRGFRWIGVGTSDGREAGVANPIFWRDSRLELLSWETRWLSPTPEVPGSVGWESMFPRAVTAAIFRERGTGAELHVFNAHFDHHSSPARLESARIISAMVNELPADTRVIVMGDFNCGPDSEPLQELQHSPLRQGRECSEHGHYGPTGSFTGFSGPQYTGPLIDHILVSPALKVQQYAVLPDHADGHLPSDHFPVLAELLMG
jgi:endonuclease/exonuclease/phosphatase family metal-dependent hydrolase